MIIYIYIYIRNKHCDAKMHIMFYFQRISILFLILEKFFNQKTPTNAEISAFAAQQRELNIFAQCMWVVFSHDMIYNSPTFFTACLTSAHSAVVDTASKIIKLSSDDYHIFVLYLFNLQTMENTHMAARFI